MKQVSISEARSRLSELVDEVRTAGEAVVIQKGNRDVAVIVEIERYRQLQDLEERVRSAQLRQNLHGRSYPLRSVLAEMGFGV